MVTVAEAAGVVPPADADAAADGVDPAAADAP
jgi:hypothetical protein